MAKTDSKIISMVHLNSYTLAETTAGATTYKKGGYIVGVATEPEFRRHGIMSILMKHVLAYAAENDYDYIYLMPEKEIYYKGLGFAPVVESGFYNITDLKPEKNDYELCGLEDITDEQLQSFLKNWHNAMISLYHEPEPTWKILEWNVSPCSVMYIL